LLCDRSWANDLLRYGIRVAKGLEGWTLPHNWKNRLFILDNLISLVTEEGFWWQAKTLQIWRSKFLRGDFTQGVPPLGSDTEKKFELVYKLSQGIREDQPCVDVKEVVT
jgi:hypothetical protein